MNLALWLRLPDQVGNQRRYLYRTKMLCVSYVESIGDNLCVVKGANDCTNTPIFGGYPHIGHGKGLKSVLSYRGCEYFVSFFKGRQKRKTFLLFEVSDDD